MTVFDTAVLGESRGRQGNAHGWHESAVFYEVIVRTFADSNDDGVGDLPGLTGKLDYLRWLGVDCLWLPPFYPSPLRDGGYDVADYTDIDSAYGGLAAFEKLLGAAHERGLRVIMDLVPNHCSSAHPWFQQALASPPGSPERARFHFRDGRGPDGAEPPNNWLSTFSGPAWTRVVGTNGPEQWYLHSFDTTQPDFDWSNPEVADMFDGVLRTWFDRGVDGFRVDVAYAMVKREGLPDAPDPKENPYAWNQPGVHEIFARWRAIADSYKRDIPLIGEVWLGPDQAADYIRPGELHEVFYFDLMLRPWSAEEFREAIDASIRSLRSVPEGGGVAAWTLNNHDVHRSVSRYGLIEAEPMDTDDANALRVRARGEVNVPLGIRRARAAALLLLALPGSVYLYQGEELGLPEVLDLPDDARRDPIWFRSSGREHGRDGSRVPLPWVAGSAGEGESAGAETGVSLGFSPPGAAPSWLPQPDWYADYAVDTQERDPASTLNVYRAALRARAILFADDDFEWLDADRADVIAFRRGAGVSVTVMGTEPFEPPPSWGTIVLSSQGGDGTELAPDTTAWLETDASN